MDRRVGSGTGCPESEGPCCRRRRPVVRRNDQLLLHSIAPS